MDRQVDAVEISYFLNAVAEKGVILSASNGGSGVAMEDTYNTAAVVANSSGCRPLGMLLTEFVNVDLTRQSINWHKDQAQIGDKAAIMTKGWAVTDKVVGAPLAGDYAALGSSGTIIPITPALFVAGWNKAANPIIGRFRTKVNEDGFARVYVDL